MQNESSVFLMTVEDAARRLNDLQVARILEFGRNWTQKWLVFKFFNVSKYTPNKFSGRSWIFDRDIIGNGFQIR